MDDTRFQIGEIVYFVRANQRTIDWGVCQDYYCDGYGLSLYEIPDFRTVCGVPIQKFEFNQPRRKLPKGWAWNTDLCMVQSDVPPAISQKYQEIHIDHPDELLAAIHTGLLVKPSSQSKTCSVEADITKDGYTIVCKYPRDVISRPDFKCVRSDRCYKTYVEAQAVVAAYEAELFRQSQLSDRDWSIEQIERVLERWKAIYGVSEEVVAKTMAWLLAQDHLEDLEVRIFGGCLQFKRDRHMRWTALEQL